MDLGHDGCQKKDGKQIQIVYGIQEKPNGIATGLWIAKEYVGDDSCMLYLGDNIIEDDLTPYVEDFKGGATVFLKEVDDPERFGVAELDTIGNIIGIEEKPSKPKSSKAVIGLYMYDNSVFRMMDDMEPSNRGEFEITTINEALCQAGKLTGVTLEKEWFDIGTFDSMLEASIHMKKKGNKF